MGLRGLQAAQRAQLINRPHTPQRAGPSAVLVFTEQFCKQTRLLRLAEWNDLIWFDFIHEMVRLQKKYGFSNQKNHLMK